MAIIFIGLVILNWILYHKLFDVVYFNLGAGIFKEFGGCIFMAGIEMALFGLIGPYLIGILAVILVICLIRKIIKKRKGDQPIITPQKENN